MSSVGYPAARLSVITRYVLFLHILFNWTKSMKGMCRQTPKTALSLKEFPVVAQKLQTDVMTAESSPDTDEAPLKRRKVNQEKRRCPECAAQVGPRFGTGKKGDGSQCPGLSASGERCTYVFSGSRRKQIYQELFERCTSKAETNLADAKGAFERATRKVRSPF